MKRRTGRLGQAVASQTGAPHVLSMGSAWVRRAQGLGGGSYYDPYTPPIWLSATPSQQSVPPRAPPRLSNTHFVVVVVERVPKLGLQALPHQFHDDGQLCFIYFDAAHRQDRGGVGLWWRKGERVG